MKYRYIILGTTIGTITVLGSTLGFIAAGNARKQNTIDQKESELREKTYSIIPEESRVLSRPTGPAFPSPGYEN